VRGEAFEEHAAPERSTAMADVAAHITGTVWKIEVKVGQQISAGETLVILESMKMEMPVEAEEGGTVKEIRCKEAQAVNEGDVLVVLG
jgi:acetyl-CoA carboxylase biotin carboxyl carrier protein